MIMFARHTQDTPRKPRRGRWTVVVMLAMLAATWVGWSGEQQLVRAAGDTLYVNGSYPDTSIDCSNPSTPCATVTGALDQASQPNSDITTIVISGANSLGGSAFNGVYCEQVSIEESLTLEAQDPTNPPTIDGSHGSSGCSPSTKYSVVTVGNANKPTLTVSLLNLVIQNGDASGDPSTPYSNPGDGGGLLVFPGTSLTVTNSTVKGNTACSGSCSSAGGFGGGIANTGTLTLINSTVSANSACSGSCIGGSGGGGIFTDGSLTLRNSVVSGNITCYAGACPSANGTGGGIDTMGPTSLIKSAVDGNIACNAQYCNGYGGGIVNNAYATGPVALTDSTVSNNRANAGCGSSSCGIGQGGGIFSYESTTIVTDSTVAGNVACETNFCTSGSGGGVYNSSANGTGALALTDSTISGNVGCSGTSSCSGTGGGIDNDGLTAALTNTILAYDAASDSGTSTGDDCSGTLTDGKPDPGNPSRIVGDNIIGSTSGCTVSGLTHNDHPGVDPLLDSDFLQDNGGPTKTIALLPGSPAIGAGDPSTCGLVTLSGGTPGPDGTDQRGEPYPTSASGAVTSCDIGAYHPVSTVYVAITGSDANACVTATAPCRHIGAGLAIAWGGGTVNVAGGTYCEQLAIVKSVKLLGSGTNGSIVDGGAASANNPCPHETPGRPVMTVGVNAGSGTPMTVTIQGLTIQHGDASAGDCAGGGLLVYSKVTLALNSSTVADNTGCSVTTNYSEGGGLLISASATVTLTNTTVRGNTACNSTCGTAFGGGITNGGTLTLTNSTVSGNSACGPSCTSYGAGGGIDNTYGTSLTLNGSTVSNNVACSGSCTNLASYGGGIETGGPVTLTNSTVTGNTGCSGSCTTVFGGGIYADRSLSISSTRLSDNAACSGTCGTAYGGGLYNAGATQTLTQITLTNNSACRGSCTTAYGGAMYSNGALSLTGGTVGSNTGCSNACSSTYGGGIDNDGTLTVNGTTVSGNTGCSGSCFGYGGGISNVGTNSSVSTTLTDATVSQNTACSGPCTSGSGGGIYNGNANGDGGAVSLTGSVVSTNTANAGCSAGTACGEGDGGGIYNENGTLTLTTSTVTGNLGCDGTCFGSGSGGGIDNFGSGTGNATLTRTTVSDNVARTGAGACSSCSGQGGGIFSYDTPTTLTNSTVSENIACTAGACGAYGGGISAGTDNGTGTLTLVNSTVSRNEACTVNPCATSATKSQGGGIDDSDRVTGTVSNTIVAENGAGVASSGPDCYGSLADGAPNGTTVGDNIIGVGNGCTGLTDKTNGDQVGGTSNGALDPYVIPLAKNGGPTETLALGPNSVAIGAGDPATCRSTSGTTAINNVDQRGLSRRADSRLACDVGAFDTGDAVPIGQGWNLIAVPLSSASTNRASLLLNNMNGQLAGAIKSLATYAHGGFHVYIPGYTADQTLQPSQGIEVLSSKAGAWTPPGTAYSGGQVHISLQPGWNLVAAPDIYRGMNGDDINTAIGSHCGLKEVAMNVYSLAPGIPTGYQIYTPNDGPTGAAFHVPNTLGMWIQCTTAYTWTP